MKLNKKQSPTGNYPDNTQEYKKGERYDPRTMSLLYNTPLPFGKYKGRTIEEVMEDDKYWRWMNENNLITSWGLCQMKPVKKGTQVIDEEHIQSITDDGGHEWIGLRIIEEQCEPSKWL